MQNHQLTAIFKIKGIGAASGLYYKDSSLFIISDNSNLLYQYSTETELLEKIKLDNDSKNNIAKSEKPDFESLVNYNGRLYLFGSGSSAKRNRLFEVDVKTRQLISMIDLSNLYAAMRQIAQLFVEDFNIEGALFDGNCWLLFNRGNGKTNRNIIFTIDDIMLKENFKIVYQDYELPKINGVSSSFTDGVFFDDKIYFLATAEDTISTYDDGVVFGSLIGQIDRKTMEVGWTSKITDSFKLEGLSLYCNSKQYVEFLLCEDNDSESLESTIYKLVLEKGRL
jgi:hypothetical protein